MTNTIATHTITTPIDGFIALAEQIRAFDGDITIPVAGGMMAVNYKSGTARWWDRPDGFSYAVSPQYCARCAQVDRAGSNDGGWPCVHKAALAKALRDQPISGMGDEEFSQQMNDDNERQRDYDEYMEEKYAHAVGVL